MSSATTNPTPHRSPSDDNIIDTSPLLADSARRPTRRRSLRDAARFLRRASSRRMMREPSMMVRETAAEQLEERQSDWAYSKPVVILDILWNFAFVVVAAAVMVLSRKERPSMPLRVWIIGYAAQCVLHMVCVVVEYRRRRRRGVESVGSDGNSSSGSRRDSGEYVSLANLQDEGNSRYGLWFSQLFG